jgi:dCMP deaminase
MNNEEKLPPQLWFADKIAKKSKDQSTKVGAVIYNDRETSPISFGYNGMPRGLQDDHPERNERPEKYSWFEHAERNAIYNVARELLEDKIIFCSHFPNMESARAIVSSGIKSVIVDKGMLDENDKDSQRAIELFSETGVKLITPDVKNLPDTFEKFHLECFGKENWVSPITVKITKEKYKEARKYCDYLILVKEYGETYSPDRDKKSACLIFNEKTFAPIAAGVSSPPAGIAITEEMHQEKHFWFQEPEKNAIFDAVYPKLKGCSFEVTWCPCIKCALAVVSVGTNKVKTRAPDFTKEADLRWKVDFEQSQKLFNLANIQMVFANENKIENTNTQQVEKLGMKKK